MPKEDTQFKPGGKGGPGRPKGSSGRTQAFGAVNAVMAEAENMRKFKAALQKAFDKGGPIAYYLTFLAPFIPKENRLELDLEPKVIARILKRGADDGKGRGKDRSKGGTAKGPAGRRRRKPTDDPAD